MRRLARLLVRLSARPGLADTMCGDLEEEHARRLARDGALKAGAWYWGQALRSVGPNLRGRLRWARRGAEGPGGGESVAHGFVQDARLGARTVLRAPLFSGIVVLTLALGIGATTTVFSVVDGLIFNPFPFPDADRVVGVGTAFPRLRQEMGFWENLSTHEYVDIREQVGSLEDVVAWDMGFRAIGGADGPPLNTFAAFWWGDPLRTMRLEPHLGRSFTEEELRTGARVALLSHRSWVEVLGADPSAVGSVLTVNGEPYTLVGVAPEGVSVYGTDLWLPMGVSPLQIPRNRRQYQVMGRIAPGEELEDVNAELGRLAARTAETHQADFEEYAGWAMEARTWAAVTSGSFRNVGVVFLGAVGFVLLLVCANVANLLLARGARRSDEMAVRRSLGAGRWRLLRQLLTESVVLAALGGIGAVAVAVAGIRGLVGVIARMGIPMVAGDPSLDLRALLFTGAAALGVGVAVGVVPALQITRRRGAVAAGLAPAGRGDGTGLSVRRLHKVFVGVEVALALALLAGGGLLVHSLLRIGAVDPGVAADEVLTMRLTLPWERYDADGIRVFFQELSERTAAIPGVTTTAAASQFPPNGFSARELELEGMVADDGDALPTALTTVVTPGYFETLGIPLLRGRGVTAEDGPDAPPVAVVNETFARTWFPGRDAVGQRVRLAGAGESPWFSVVGVAADARNRGIDAPPMAEVFVPQAQAGGGNQLFLLLRTRGDPRSALPAVREVVREMDPDQPIYSIQTVADAIRSQSASRRASTVLLLVFAAFALLLAASGVYGVVAYAVGERTGEIGVRMALGAAPGAVRRMVVRQALGPVVAGLVAGLGLAWVVGRGLESLLYEVGAGDPWSLGGVTAVLLGVAVVASWVPARRASRLSPAGALRRE